MHGTFTLDRQTQQAISFESARTRYEQACAEFDRLWAVAYAAEEAEELECPRVDHYFDEYKLGIGMSRERVVETLRWYAYRGARPVDVDATADEFMAYQESHKECHERHRTEELNDAASEYGETHYFPARAALMAAPAPDAEALLLKMEIAATWADEPFVDSCFADVRRLLSEA